MLFPTEELIFSPSHDTRSGVVRTTCGSRPYACMTSTPGQQVVELVGAAELDVGFDGDRVVRLHERVQELRDRDRLPARVAPGEVVALQHLRDRHHPRQPNDVGEAELREPLAVAPDLGLLGDEDLEGLVDIRLGVPVDLVVVQDRPCRDRPDGSPIRGRVVADDAGLPRGPRPGTRACAASGMPRPTWMSGDVTSIPSFTRSGRPSASFASSAPQAARGRHCA